MGELLFPSVRWAQDEKSIFLKVELTNVQDPDIKFTENKLEFQAVGEGAKGCNQYYFSLSLYDPIVEQECFFKIQAMCVNIVLKKKLNPEEYNKDKAWWPRLIAKTEKLPWLKIDFNKWRDPEISSSDDEEDARKKLMRNFDMEAYEKQQAEEMWKNMNLEDKDFLSRSPFDLTKIYLACYNAALFLGFLFIIYDLSWGYFTENTDYFPKVWDQVAGKMFCCQLAQFLEIGHVLLGYVKSSLPTTIMQVFGRSLVLFMILNGDIRMHDKPFVFYLFFVWSAVEIIRYPYYLCATSKKEIRLLTWLRYSAWIILYPLGFLCEGIILLRAMPYYEETGKYSVQLPNSFNVSFDFPSVLKLYFLFVFLPGVAILMSHMRQLRLKKLSKKKLT